jgi:hypothetical protein
LLTRGQVSGILDAAGTGAGAFSSSADLPVFGRVDKVLPIDAGGGTPEKSYQFVAKVDWNMGNATQAYTAMRSRT